MSFCSTSTQEAGKGSLKNYVASGGRAGPFRGMAMALLGILAGVPQVVMGLAHNIIFNSSESGQLAVIPEGLWATPGPLLIPLPQYTSECEHRNSALNVCRNIISN